MQPEHHAGCELREKLSSVCTCGAVHMEAHTPGPWLMQPYDEDCSGIPIIADNLGGLVGLSACWPTEIDTGGSDRVKANAKLMAASPLLLEAAKDLAREVCTTFGAEDIESGCCPSCRARRAVAAALA